MKRRSDEASKRQQEGETIRTMCKMNDVDKRRQEKIEKRGSLHML